MGNRNCLDPVNGTMESTEILQPDCEQAAPTCRSVSYWAWGVAGDTLGSEIVCADDSWSMGWQILFTMLLAIGASRAANIIPIFAIGNSGSSCLSVNAPGDYENVIGVGAVEYSDEIASFSSRGPTLDGRLKPEVSAPGDDIRSSCYETTTNTGAVAILLAKNKDLTFDEVKNLLQDNADQYFHLPETCSSDNSTFWPNNVYGHGRINVKRALTALIGGSQ
ncbi:Bacillopeptidase F [Orchesella cincta]|uniref:Bacillopeptidase F n=1 Tax=Orchesella cincta TaxID=48709 RepID=A0A1D2MGR7_ORCCI|nr:Bacillopeptidase F [Orchesella cincta]